MITIKSEDILHKKAQDQILLYASKVADLVGFAQRSLASRNANGVNQASGALDDAAVFLRQLIQML